MVEWGGLENRCGRKATEGSNPSLSANFLVNPSSRIQGVLGLSRRGFELKFDRRVLSGGWRLYGTIMWLVKGWLASGE